MNLQQFLDHWKIVENPFKGEEARQDPVFLRLEALSQAGIHGHAPVTMVGGDKGAGAASSVASHSGGQTAHSEFEKIVGDFARPSTAIVFGEKGSGKTAMRLQLADRLQGFNASHPGERCLWIGYDDLNPILSRFLERVKVERKATVTDTLGKLKLVDHIDAMMTLAVPPMVDALLKERSPVLTGTPSVHVELTDEPKKIVKKMDPQTRRDLLCLQVVYDRPDLSTGAERRTARLRRLLRVRPPASGLLWAMMAYFGWLPAAAMTYYAYVNNQINWQSSVFTQFSNAGWAIIGLLALYLIVLFKRSVFDRLKFITLGHRIRKQVRVSLRTDASYGRSLRYLPTHLVDAGVLPMTPSDDVRYAMLDRFKGVLKALGYNSAILVVDRADEPTLVSGDPDRMKAVIWPLLNNKLLSQPFMGVKMLLPMELRHALFRESAAFFQEARLDKQNMIERLSWTGSMLYDLCNARLQACRAGDAPSLNLLELFAEDVTRADLIDALDQMHQPRDAFKLLYQCLVDHCASVTSDQSQWRIPRLILTTVKTSQVERVKQLYRGIRPA